MELLRLLPHGIQEVTGSSPVSSAETPLRRGFVFAGVAVLALAFAAKRLIKRLETLDSWPR